MTKLFGRGGSRQPLESGIITDRRKIVIGVKGIGRGAGATFTAVNLAFEMADLTGGTEGITYMEAKTPGPGSRSISDILGVDAKFRKQASRGGTLFYKNVSWVSGGSGYRSPAGRFIIVDDPEEYQELDIIIGVADPLPSRIEAGLETYKELRQQQMPVIWVANKCNPQAGIREVEHFLKQKFDYRLELIPPEVFYKAEFSCTHQYFLRKPAALEKAAREILEHNK